MDSLAIKTYAKINLSLDVTGVREDGYHLVRMVMQSVDLSDEMRVRLLPAEETEVILKCNKYYVPTDSRNTAYKAAEMMIAAYPEIFRRHSVRIDIRKNIPVSAGLAGGSSNAAGVIVALNHFLDLGMDLRAMCEMGARIGADVPFCIMTLTSRGKWKQEGGASCALAEGIGDELTPLKPVRLWCVLAKPPLSVSTAEVYRGLDALDGYVHPEISRTLDGIRDGNLQILQKGLGNVLENYTLRQYPVVDALKTKMLRYNPDMTLMSGSGPTVYSLFTGRKKALLAYTRLRDELKGSGTEIFLTRTLV